MLPTPFFDPLVDQLPSRFVVGIDLGTTNSAVTYVDTEEEPWQIRILPIPQLVAAAEVEALETLPSFHFQPVADQAQGNALRLPWQHQAATFAVGTFARDAGAHTSGRAIASAKSWLSHAGVDRTAPLLPWHGAADVERLSPVQVSSRYLDHIRQAWDATHPQHKLAEQDLVLTLPASFDEVARELTVEAAAQAGLRRVVLIEEPQAAFYAWVYKHATRWHQQVTAGQKILVCDIGGGTTDFTLIRVRHSDLPLPSSASSPVAGTQGATCPPTDEPVATNVQFHRVAVGEHLILGGDNLDLALARYVEQRLDPVEGKLPPRQWDVLVNLARRAKEALLGKAAPESYTLNLPSSGAKLIGGGLQTQVTRQDVEKLLVDGFLPFVDLDARPERRSSGFQEFGLPYAADPAITRYLASFLTAHRDVARQLDAEAPAPLPADAADSHDPARPDVVLFNGGFFESPVLRQRVIDVLSRWFSTSGPWAPLILDNDRLDMAVARGAAYYGMVRRGVGVRIVASLARSYYVELQDQPGRQVALCLVPGNAEPGQDINLPERMFRLRVSEPVEFPLWVSSTRLVDRPGDLVAIDREQMKPMPPIRTVLKTDRRAEADEIEVQLHVRLTEIGTIDLWCQQVATDRRWRLQFDVRPATQTDLQGHEGLGEAEGFWDESTWGTCQRVLQAVFRSPSTPSRASSPVAPQGSPADPLSIKPEELVKAMTSALGMERHEWPMSLLRRIGEALMEYEAGRRRGAAHEARWLNLLGYALRPGYGFAVDDWRVAETWRHVRGKLVHNTPAIQNEALILWRRIAGGLTAGQQMAIAEPLLAAVRNLHRRSTTGKAQAGATLRPEESHEIWRLLGSLELLQTTLKVELGSMLVELLDRKKFASAREAMVWALGRLGQRAPVYGPLNTVVPTDQAARWLRALISPPAAPPIDHLAVMQLARRHDDRYRDLSNADRDAARTWLLRQQASEHLIKLVAEGGQLDEEEQGRVFGEALPKGLRIV
jgi:molecular chaperone DnaK (HSP70)